MTLYDYTILYRYLWIYIIMWHVKSCYFNSTLLFKTLVFVNTSSAWPLHTCITDAGGLGQKAPDYNIISKGYKGVWLLYSGRIVKIYFHTFIVYCRRRLYTNVLRHCNHSGAYIVYYIIQCLLVCLIFKHNIDCAYCGKIISIF